MCDNSINEVATLLKFHCYETFCSPTVPVTSLQLETYINHHLDITGGYADDIFNTLRETEQNRQLIFFRSQQNEFRPMLLRFLRLAAEKNSLARITLHLAVSLLDCFMDAFTVRADKLNLVAIVCLILAAKVEETEMRAPQFADLNSVVGSVYSLNEFKNVERKVLNTLNFKLLRPTVATFAEFFANNFITLDDFHLYCQIWHNTNVNYNPQQPIDKRLKLPLYRNHGEMSSFLNQELFKLVDISLTYWKLANARPSLLAAACIAAVRRLNHLTPAWTPYLVELTKYTESEIQPFVEALLILHKMNVPPTRVTNTLCESPDSGIVSISDTKSDTSESSENDEEDEDETYNCSDYPLLIKRRRLN